MFSFNRKLNIELPSRFKAVWGFKKEKNQRGGGSESMKWEKETVRLALPKRVHVAASCRASRGLSWWQRLAVESVAWYPGGLGCNSWRDGRGSDLVRGPQGSRKTWIYSLQIKYSFTKTFWVCLHLSIKWKFKCITCHCLVGLSLGECWEEAVRDSQE